jgi:hypothetical protein
MSFFFDGDLLARSWQRLVLVLLRTALVANTSKMGRGDLEDLLDEEARRSWMPAHVRAFDGKEHFLLYAGRYVRPEWTVFEKRWESWRNRTESNRKGHKKDTVQWGGQSPLVRRITPALGARRVA